MKNAPVAGRPEKGVKPSFAGVAGILVDEAPEGIEFGARKQSRLSPYDPLLVQLKAAGAGKFLKFSDLRCRPSIMARSKKLGIKVLFGEQGNTLYVTLATAELEVSGIVEPQPPKPSNSDLVLRAISEKRRKPGEILTWLRSNGVAGIGITQVDGLLINLLRAGKVRRSGEDDSQVWSLAA
jgi:hypothetical protein